MTQLVPYGFEPQPETVEAEVRDLALWTPPAPEPEPSIEPIPEPEPSNGHYEQAKFGAEGMGRFEGVAVRMILVESQLLHDGETEITVTLEHRGSMAIKLDVPEVLSPDEADTLRGMLDRAVKSAKAAV
jgi:hypothetical protein